MTDVPKIFPPKIKRFHIGFFATRFPIRFPSTITNLKHWPNSFCWQSERFFFIFNFLPQKRTLRTEAIILGGKHEGTCGQVWAVRKIGVITMQAAETPYSVNGPIY